MKLVVVEDGSENMLHFAESLDDNRKVVSAIAMIEATSTVSRLRKGRRLLTDEAALAFDFVAEAIGSMTVQPISQDVLNCASRLAEQRCLRALDAVQLASAIVARDLSATPDIRFIASDKELLIAAQKEGFQTWNPCD